MNRFRDFPGLPAAARFRLAAAYAMAGMGDAASSVTRGLSAEVKSYPGMADHTYGTETRDRAVVLDALVAMGDTARALPVYNRLAEELDSKLWFSTQDLGVALAAALPYVVLAASPEAPTATVSLGGSDRTFEVRLDRPMARVDLPEPEGFTASVEVANPGRSPIFARVICRGTPAAGNEKPQASGVSLSQRYLGMDGKVLDPAKAAAGATFIVEATVRNRSGQDLKNLALTQLLPSGWEIVNFRAGAELPKPRQDGDQEGDGGPAPAAPSPLFDYQDVRDDRVLSYFSMGIKEPKVFKIYVTKAYDGVFFLPAASVSAMYDERYQAIVPGRWLDGRAAPPAGGAGKKRSGAGSSN